jgi:hypothetical protein
VHDQPRTELGKFSSYYKEPRGQAIAIRLPKSLDDWLVQHCQENGISKAEWLVSVAFDAAFNAIEGQIDS